MQFIRKITEISIANADKGSNVIIAVKGMSKGGFVFFFVMLS